MKKITLILSLFVMSLFVVACGASNDTGTKDNNDSQVKNEQSSKDNGTSNVNPTDDDGDDTNTKDTNVDASADDNIAKMNGLAYIDFELKVDYDKTIEDDNEYDAELKLENNNRVEAEIEDDINGIKKEGQAAFDELFPLVEQLTITADTTKEDAIQEVLNVFNLEANYEEFELDIEFKDGSKFEIEDNK